MLIVGRLPQAAKEGFWRPHDYRATIAQWRRSHGRKAATEAAQADRIPPCSASTTAGAAETASRCLDGLADLDRSRLLVGARALSSEGRGRADIAGSISRERGGEVEPKRRRPGVACQARVAKRSRLRYGSNAAARRGRSCESPPEGGQRVGRAVLSAARAGRRRGASARQSAHGIA